MGNQQSFEKNTDFKDLKSNFTYQKKYSDSRFGEVKLIKENTTGRTLFQKDLTTSTAQEFQSYIKDIKDSSVLQHPNILRVYGYNSKKEDLFCADFYKVSLFFESFDTDLEQEINKRQHSKEYFQETELWFILDSLASACAYLQINNVPHRDIRPFNVFINSNKDYKLSATNLFRQSYNPAYFGNFEGLEEQNHNFSPEILQHLSKSSEQRKTVSYDEHKSDVFGLGLTMLEAGNLEKPAKIYNYKKFEVNETPIKESLNNLRSRYSENFVRTVESLIDPNPDRRLDFIKLDRELSIYRRDIREKARGPVPPSPIAETPNTQDIMYERRASPVRPVRSGAPDLVDDLDNRVREAVRRSEEIIQRTSPSKRSHKDLDPFIQSYLRNENNMKEQPLLSYIAPYLTSESKYTTTLTIEQPNYGRESQPINFGQGPLTEGAGESIKRSAFVDVIGSNQAHAGGYLQQGATYGGADQTGQAGTPTYGHTGVDQPAQAATFGQIGGSNYGQTTTGNYDNLSGSQYLQQQTRQTGTFGQPSTSNYGTTGADQTAQAGGYGQTTTGNYGNLSGSAFLKQSGQLGSYGQGGNYGQTTGNYDLSGLAGGYGTTGANYGTTGGTYTTTTYNTTTYGGPGGKDYAAEADDLTKRIEERLNQSKQVNVQTY